MKTLLLKCFALFAVVTLGCQGKATCSYPMGSDTTSDAGDAGVVGCSPGPAMNICEQAASGSQTCHSACGESDYTLTCRGGDLMPSTIPEPAGSLNCTVIPIPTPSNARAYCCHCGQ